MFKFSLEVALPPFVEHLFTYLADAVPESEDVFETDLSYMKITDVDQITIVQVDELVTITAIEDDLDIFADKYYEQFDVEDGVVVSGATFDGTTLTLVFRDGQHTSSEQVIPVHDLREYGESNGNSDHVRPI